MKKLPLLAVGLLLCFSLSAQSNIRLNSSNFDVPPQILEDYYAYDLVELDVTPFYERWQQAGNELDFQLQLPSSNVTFDLVRYDQRAPNYILESSDQSRTYQRSPAAQYKGRVLDEGGAQSVFTIDEQYVLGYWQQSGEEYYLEPLWLLWDEAPHNVYLVYKVSDIDPYIGECGYANDNTSSHEDRETIPPVLGQEMMPCLDVEIALASDFLLYQAFGNNAVSVQNFMLNTLALVQTNYDSQVGDNEFANEMNYFVTDVFIDTNNPDQWTTDTDADELLTDFQDWGNAGNFTNSYDVASLWTARDFDGTTVGLAFRPGVCTNSRYNVLERFNSNSASLRSLWAHELGHNWSLVHDADGSNFIMAPSVTLTNNWSANSMTMLNSYVNSVSCLSTCATAVPNVVTFVPYTNVCAGSQVALFDDTAEDAVFAEWQLPGASPSSSSSAYPVVTYNNPGNFTATLTVTNSFGDASSQTNITVLAENSTNVLFYENFEEGFGNIAVINPNNNFTWEIAEITGNRGNRSALINNYDNNGVGQSDFLQLPQLDLTDLAGTTIEIEYAYSPFIGPQSDIFKVNVTSMAGTQNVFTSDVNFPTKPATDNSRFIPAGPQDWCSASSQCLSIDLSAFDGQSNITISLENENNFGNILYVDNIAVVANCPAAAPVEWLSFSTKALRSAAQLDWVVNQDEMHAGFVIERSTSSNIGNNLNSWKEIGYLNARGGATNNVSYQFQDTDVQPGGTYFYRLRQQDLDGRESISSIQRVTFKGSEGISVFPNPTNSSTSIRIGSDNGTYQLIDPLGKVIAQGIILDGQARVDLNQFPAAVYWLRVQSDDQASEIVKLVKR